MPLYANHRWLRLQWAHEHRTWKADWHQVNFSGETPTSICGTMKTTFMLDAMAVNAAFESALLNNIVAEHPELWYIDSNTFSFWFWVCCHVGEFCGSTTRICPSNLNSMSKCNIQMIFF